MNSLTAAWWPSQLRALPMPGGKSPAAYCYVVRIPGGWEPVNHSFRDWAVGDFSMQGEGFTCRNSTENTGISGGLLSTSLAMTARKGMSSFAGKVTRMTECSLLSSSGKSLKGWTHER